MDRMRTLGGLVAVLVMVVSCSSGAVPQVMSPSPTAVPPAVSSIDHVVDISWELKDSFDVTADGTCTGRGDDRAMHDCALVRFHGDSTGVDDEIKITARYVRTLPTGKSASFDDGKTCVLRAVFAPRMPDPRGYTITFPGSTVPVASTGPMSGMTPFGMANEPPGYGRLRILVQKCRDPVAPPEQDCSPPTN